MNRDLRPSPIIIFGAARSGTTYLVQLLNAHPEVYVTNEARIFMWVHQSLSVLTADELAVFEHRGDFVAHLKEEYPRLIRRFYGKLTTRRYWGDKSPYYAGPCPHPGCLDTIASLFPDARFIHIVRDARDVITSFLRMRHPDGKPWTDFPGAHAFWNNDVQNAADFNARRNPAHYFELRYEDLVKNDLEWARRIFAFLDVPFHSAVRKFCRVQAKGRTPFSGPTRDLGLGVNRSDWETSFTPEQRLATLELVGRHLVRFGYETEDSLKGIRRRLSDLC